MRTSRERSRVHYLNTLSTTFASLIALTFAQTAFAGPADKVYMPIVEVGETEFELRGGDQRLDSGGHARAFVLDIGHGVTRHWFTELAVEYEDGPAGSGEIEAIEWENVFQLTEQGRYWLDVGIFAEYEYSLESGEPDEIVIGPMFQKDIGSVQANLNVLFERRIGSGMNSEIETGYAGQLKWRGRPEREFGLQAFGEEDEHLLGPAFFGSYRLSGGHKLEFDAAVLLGVTDAAPDIAARFQIEYEM